MPKKLQKIDVQKLYDLMQAFWRWFSTEVDMKLIRKIQSALYDELESSQIQKYVIQSDEFVKYFAEICSQENQDLERWSRFFGVEFEKTQKRGHSLKQEVLAFYFSKLDSITTEYLQAKNFVDQNLSSDKREVRTRVSNLQDKMQKLKGDIKQILVQLSNVMQVFSSFV